MLQPVGNENNVQAFPANPVDDSLKKEPVIGKKQNSPHLLGKNKGRQWPVICDSRSITGWLVLIFLFYLMTGGWKSFLRGSSN
jgi:hypothetical protein